MRLLHVSHQYPPAIGGSERYIADLSERLAARDHGVDVFTARSRDYHDWRSVLPAFERINGVNVRRYRALRRRAYVWRCLHFGLRHYWSHYDWWWEPFIFFGGGPLCPGMFIDMLRYARQYDLVHLNCLVYSHVAYGYWAARWRRVPIVITPHLHIDQPNTYIIGFMQRALKGCDHVIAVTEAERKHIIGLGVDADRVSTAGNGVCPENFPPLNRSESRRLFDLPLDAFVLLFFGRKDEYKGIGRVLDAFAELHQRHPKLFLLTVGPETDFSRQKAEHFQGLPRWINRGAVSDEERRHALNAADCLALPSEGEAFGIVFLEAWLMGTAVIGPRNPAVATVISEGRDGLLVEPRNVAELVEAIESLVTCPQTARMMGEAGRSKVLQRYTVERIADLVETIYQRVIERRRVRMSGTEVIEIPDPNIDQEAIHRRLQAQIEQRKADGLDEPAPPGNSTESLQPPGPVPVETPMLEFPEFNHALASLAAGAALREQRLDSRLPLIGPLVAAVRRIWNAVATKQYVRPIIQQQSDLNAQMARLISEVVQWQGICALEIRALRARVQELEERLLKVEKR